MCQGSYVDGRESGKTPSSVKRNQKWMAEACHACPGERKGAVELKFKAITVKQYSGYHLVTAITKTPSG